MSLRDAIKGFSQGLRGAPAVRPTINVTPGLEQLEVVDTTKPPTRANIPGSWSTAMLGPGQPFAAGMKDSARDKDSETEPRSFQYISSVNSTMSPRIAYGLTPFSDLRTYAESVPEVSMCLRLLTEEMKAFVPTIVDSKETKILDSPYKWMTERPDGFNPFPVWLSKFLYNVLIYDAGCSYLVRNSRKKIVGSRVIDGSTIFVVIDERGEQPRPPAPAFQQIIWGVPRLFMNTKQLWYKPRHLRADAPYGRSPIEDSLPAVKLLQSLWEYEYLKYQVGNIPEMVFAAPESWKDSADAILEFEMAFNARMAGNSQERVRARFMPAGTEALQTKQLDFNQESYASATNAVRMSFGILQSEVGEGPNQGLGGKGYAEAMQSAFYRMGLAPLISYTESHFNDIIAMNGDDEPKFKLEFPAESLDPTKEEEKYATRFQIGGIKRDEYRQGIGMAELGGEEGNFLMSPGGGGEEGENPFDAGAGGKPGMINVGNKNNVQVRRPVKVFNKPLNVLKNPIPVQKLDMPDVKSLGEQMGVDWEVVDLDEFTAGVKEELEHAETVGNDMEVVAQIALDHLAEDPKYYAKLKTLFSKYDKSELMKYCGVDPEDDMLFGTAVVDLIDTDMPKQGANDSKIVSIGGGEVDARPAVWKPVTGESEKLTNWIHGELYRRAEAAYILDRELSPDEKHFLVPVSYITQVDGVDGSVQHYVTGRQPREEVTSYDTEWVERAAVLDFIMGQVDRYRKNWLTHPHNDKRPVLIDNDVSFSPDPKQKVHSTFVDAMDGRPLTEKTLDMIYLALGNHDLWEDLNDCLQDEKAVENAKARAQQVYDEKLINTGDVHHREILVKADWDEDKHPRNEDGEWTEKGSAGVQEKKKLVIPEGQFHHSFRIVPSAKRAPEARYQQFYSYWISPDNKVVECDEHNACADIILTQNGIDISSIIDTEYHVIENYAFVRIKQAKGQTNIQTKSIDKQSLRRIQHLVDDGELELGLVIYWEGNSPEGERYNIRADYEEFMSAKFAYVKDREAFIKLDWDESKHPRDEDGQWTDKPEDEPAGAPPAKHPREIIQEVSDKYLNFDPDSHEAKQYDRTMNDISDSGREYHNNNTPENLSNLISDCMGKIGRECALLDMAKLPWNDDGTVTLYRGGDLGGQSWSTDIDEATRFAVYGFGSGGERAGGTKLYRKDFTLDQLVTALPWEGEVIVNKEAAENSSDAEELPVVNRNLQTGNSAGETPEPAMPDPDSVWDEEGIGSMPVQRGTHYGRNRKMKASEFLNLVPPMNYKEGTLPWMEQAIKDGTKLAPPTLFVRWDKKTHTWQVEDHEGRHRATAFWDVFGDVEMPVFLCFNGGLRGRDVNPDMLESEIVAQKWRGEEVKGSPPPDTHKGNEPTDLEKQEGSSETD